MWENTNFKKLFKIYIYEGKHASGVGSLFILGLMVWAGEDDWPSSLSQRLHQTQTWIAEIRL